MSKKRVLNFRETGNVPSLSNALQLYAFTWLRVYGVPDSESDDSTPRFDTRISSEEWLVSESILGFIYLYERCLLVMV